jgi:hypothetical protein
MSGLKSSDDAPNAAKSADDARCGIPLSDEAAAAWLLCFICFA